MAAQRPPKSRRSPPASPLAGAVARAVEGTRSSARLPVAPAATGTTASPTTDKREAIVDAALELFSEKGFDGTAVPAIAERAGVGAGTIYRYFESKEAIVNVLFKRYKSLLAQRLLTGLPMEAPPREQFHWFWTRAMGFARDYPRALAFLELHHHGAYLDEESRMLEENLLAPAWAFLAATHDAGVTKPVSPRVLGHLVWGAFVGLAKASWVGQIALDAATIAASEDCCWDAIRR